MSRKALIFLDLAHPNISFLIWPKTLSSNVPAHALQPASALDRTLAAKGQAVFPKPSAQQSN